MVVMLQSRREVEASRYQDEVDAAESLHELGALFARDVQAVGATVYAMGQMGCGSRPTLLFLSTWPRSWMEVYAANGFVRDDPAILAAVEGTEPFTWDEMRQRRNLGGNRVLAAAAEHGFHDGFVVPVQAGDTRGIVSLAGQRLLLNPATRRAIVEKSCICYRAAGRLYHLRKARAPVLPPREKAALSLVAKGMDDTAIGQALGIARVSAHAYVERAKRRLGANTRAQAVALAVSEGLL